jgi:hypothetical protein
LASSSILTTHPKAYGSKFLGRGVAHWRDLMLVMKLSIKRGTSE